MLKTLEEGRPRLRSSESCCWHGLAIPVLAPCTVSGYARHRWSLSGTVGTATTISPTSRLVVAVGRAERSVCVFGLSLPRTLLDCHV